MGNYSGYISYIPTKHGGLMVFHGSRMVYITYITYMGAQLRFISEYKPSVTGITGPAAPSIST
jgi:hypothetical protein